MSGFEIFGLILAIPSAILQLKQTVHIVREQCQAFVENSTNMTRVITLYDNLSEQLPLFSEELRTHAHLIPRFSLAALTYEFRMVKDHVERASRELRNITTRNANSGQVARFLRSRKVKQDWQALENGADQLMHAIRHMSITCTAIDIVVNCFREQEQRIVHELNAVRQAFFQALPHPCGGTCTSQEDTMVMRDLTTCHAPQRSLRDIDINFRSTIHCPKNPPYVFADFTSHDSPESKLLSCILRDGQTASPDIYSSRKVELTGKGGRGKTCILRSLCTNHTIVSRYTGLGKGGIYYMNLGHEPSGKDVRRKLCDMVECSGGGHLRDEILGENVSYCISILVQWFKHKDTLFLIDEAYDETEFGASVTEQLIALSTTSCRSAVVFSRRKSRFSVGEIVRLYPEGECGSRKLLLRSAGLDAEEIEDCATNEAIDSIVDMCHGNIRLLGQAGVCYKHVHGEGKREGGWVILAERLRWRLGDGEDENEAQDALIAEILNGLQVGIRRRLKRATSVHRLYRALHGVKTREWIAVKELCQVWGLECWECVMVAETLLRGRLCRMSERFVDGVLMQGVEIHDCLWAYMWREAAKHGEVAVTA